VRDSDGTVVFTLVSTPTGGSRCTIDLAASFGKPWLHLAKSGTDDPAVMLQRFVTAKLIRCLNVAGKQESEEPGIYLWVSGVIETAFWSPGNAGLP
jgi:Circularly permutated YpsA SLOG family